LNKANLIIRRKTIITVTVAVLLLLRGATFAYAQWSATKADPARLRGARDVAFARKLAAHFDRVAPPNKPAAVMISHNSDMFLISYFAGTAICWKTPGLYPRDKIFSWSPRDPDYVYVTSDVLLSTDLLLRTRPIGKFSDSSRTYYLLPTPWRPFNPFSAARRDGSQPNFATPWRLFDYGQQATFSELEATVGRDDPSLWSELLETDAGRTHSQ